MRGGRRRGWNNKEHDGEAAWTAATDCGDEADLEKESGKVLREEWN